MVDCFRSINLSNKAKFVIAPLQYAYTEALHTQAIRKKVGSMAQCMSKDDVSALYLRTRPTCLHGPLNAMAADCPRLQD